MQSRHCQPIGLYAYNYHYGYPYKRQRYELYLSVSVSLSRSPATCPQIRNEKLIGLASLGYVYQMMQRLHKGFDHYKRKFYVERDIRPYPSLFRALLDRWLIFRYVCFIEPRFSHNSYSYTVPFALALTRLEHSNAVILKYAGEAGDSGKVDDVIGSHHHSLLRHRQHKKYNNKNRKANRSRTLLR